MIAYKVKTFSITRFDNEHPITDVTAENNLMLVQDLAGSSVKYKWLDMDSHILMPTAHNTIREAKEYLFIPNNRLVTEIEDNGEI